MGTLVRSVPPQPDGTEFGPWIQGSNVVDAEGEPLRLFHGFSPGVECTSKRFLYFAFDRALAEVHEEEGGGVMNR